MPFPVTQSPIEDRNRNEAPVASRSRSPPGVLPDTALPDTALPQRRPLANFRQGRLTVCSEDTRVRLTIHRILAGALMLGTPRARAARVRLVLAREPGALSPRRRSSRSARSQEGDSFVAEKTVSILSWLIARWL
jgi:hypothetical protein